VRPCESADRTRATSRPTRAREAPQSVASRASTPGDSDAKDTAPRDVLKRPTATLKVRCPGARMEPRNGPRRCPNSGSARVSRRALRTVGSAGAEVVRSAPTASSERPSRRLAATPHRSARTVSMRPLARSAAGAARCIAARWTSRARPHAAARIDARVGATSLVPDPPDPPQMQSWRAFAATATDRSRICAPRSTAPISVRDGCPHDPKTCCATRPDAVNPHPRGWCTRPLSPRSS
jgi:hypothetical protein